MYIFTDTRQQAGKHRNITNELKRLGVDEVRTKLAVGDYTLPLDQSITIDTKKDLMEVSGNLCQQHARFAQECDLAEKLGQKLIILIEEEGMKSIEDVPKWFNWRNKKNPKAITGKTLAKIMKTFEKSHNVEFKFTSKKDTGKWIIFFLLQGKVLKENEKAIFDNVAKELGL